MADDLINLQPCYRHGITRLQCKTEPRLSVALISEHLHGAQRQHVLEASEAVKSRVQWLVFAAKQMCGAMSAAMTIGPNYLLETQALC